MGQFTHPDLRSSHHLLKLDDAHAYMRCSQRPLGPAVSAFAGCVTEPAWLSLGRPARISMKPRMLKPIFAVLILATTIILTGCSKPSVSTATIQVQYSDNHKVETALQKIVAGWNSGIEIRRIRNTDLYQISFSDPKSGKASEAVSKAVTDTTRILATAFPDAKNSSVEGSRAGLNEDKSNGTGCGEARSALERSTAPLVEHACRVGRVSGSGRPVCR